MNEENKDVSCGHMCLEMIIGIPSEKLFDIYGNDRDGGMYKRTVVKILHDYKIEHEVQKFNRLDDSVYILTVPSLNIVAGHHFIVVDNRHGRTVYDPLNGSDQKNYYKRDGSNLQSWADSIKVVPRVEINNR